MKRIFPALALVFLTACSTSPNSSSPQPRLGVWDPPVDELSRPLQAGERAPAATPPRLYWRSASKVIGVDSQGGIFEFQLPISQVQEWNDIERKASNCPVREPVWERGRCEGWSCAGANPGQSELWNAFYGAKKADKAKALEAAIKGVDEAIARKLAEANVFKSKPGSWEAFVKAMKAAESRRVIGKEIVYQTTVKYRAENLVGLGYSIQACQPVQYECDVFSERFSSVACTVDEAVTRYNEVDRILRTFRVEIRNPQLQPFETDQITVTAGKEPTDVRVSVDGHTFYQVTQTEPNGSHVSLQLTGTERLLADLPNSALRTATFVQRGSQPTLIVHVDPKFIPDGKTPDQLVLRYVIRTCKTTFGFCGKWQQAAPVEQAVTAAETAVPVAVAKGLKTEALYTIARKNSRLYRDGFVHERKTDDIRVK